VVIGSLISSWNTGFIYGTGPASNQSFSVTHARVTLHDSHAKLKFAAAPAKSAPASFSAKQPTDVVSIALEQRKRRAEEAAIRLRQDKERHKQLLHAQKKGKGGVVLKDATATAGV
jgi:hypothetical protein